MPSMAIPVRSDLMVESDTALLVSFDCRQVNYVGIEESYAKSSSATSRSRSARDDSLEIAVEINDVRLDAIESAAEGKPRFCELSMQSTQGRGWNRSIRRRCTTAWIL
jgi:hypothetical protein